MTGVKLGDRLLIAGCRDTKLIARLAVKPGLTGRTALVDDDAARASNAARFAEREGALVETFSAPWTTLPFDSGSFDIVVIRDVLATLPPDLRASSVREVHRVLRPGGRCLVIQTASRVLDLFTGRRSADGARGASGRPVSVTALEGEGFVAVRILAERAGLLFVEGVKGNTDRLSSTCPSVSA